MDLKVVAVLFLLSAFAISSSEAGIPKCCISTRRYISPRVLMKVVRWTLQKSGACDIDAVVLHFNNNLRPWCLDPTVFKNLVPYWQKWSMKKKKVQKRASKLQI